LYVVYLRDGNLIFVGELGLIWQVPLFSDAYLK